MRSFFERLTVFENMTFEALNNVHKLVTKKCVHYLFISKLTNISGLTHKNKKTDLEFHSSSQSQSLYSSKTGLKTKTMSEIFELQAILEVKII